MRLVGTTEGAGDWEMGKGLESGMSRTKERTEGRATERGRELSMASG